MKLSLSTLYGSFVAEFARIRTSSEVLGLRLPDTNLRNEPLSSELALRIRNMPGKHSLHGKALERESCLSVHGLCQYDRVSMPRCSEIPLLPFCPTFPLLQLLTNWLKSFSLDAMVIHFISQGGLRDAQLSGCRLLVFGSRKGVKD